MKSLKITLLLAAFCLTLMGLTYNNDKNADKQETNSFDIESNEYQIASSGQIKKAKPPQS